MATQSRRMTRNAVLLIPPADGDGPNDPDEINPDPVGLILSDFFDKNAVAASQLFFRCDEYLHLHPMTQQLGYACASSHVSSPACRSRCLRVVRGRY
jgi:hypothetical protein